MPLHLGSAREKLRSSWSANSKFNITYKVSPFGVFLVPAFSNSDWIWRFTKQISVFSPNTGKCGPEKLRLERLLAQCSKPLGVSVEYFGPYIFRPMQTLTESNTLPFFEVYLHVKNQNDLATDVGNITDQRIMQRLNAMPEYTNQKREP